ncbi:hypothetical protein KIN20_027472 [Parelaphostrongylus tenuis]|uniref:Uncharacterized protein n=1 Tax=Parelaphostrongylus tenuis TaxID=148309 RepID=A0AAD5QZD1_PARTN|nr:hypothetical protein KIN20_027472 [Parelaphostrongylus tenuis]
MLANTAISNNHTQPLKVEPQPLRISSLSLGNRDLSTRPPGCQWVKEDSPAELYQIYTIDVIPWSISVSPNRYSTEERHLIVAGASSSLLRPTFGVLPDGRSDYVLIVEQFSEQHLCEFHQPKA